MRGDNAVLKCPFCEQELYEFVFYEGDVIATTEIASIQGLCGCKAKFYASGKTRAEYRADYWIRIAKLDEVKLELSR